mgnify:CR=1 FL=1
MFDWYIQIKVFLLQPEDGLDKYLIAFVWFIQDKRKSNVRLSTLTDGDGKMGDFSMEGCVSTIENDQFGFLLEMLNPCLLAHVSTCWIVFCMSI